ncbi:Hypothetical predicted protein [Olea europaea subsp. europaea]|uniref:Uncharacterized protein n=1 Tax=Olea europaea subsp. europaea TaxID=158383 RepID=A0A8S0ULL8_OLEEU|nr:Hypothetical predicted protein [Olea europaea subsp. europaea]
MDICIGSKSANIFASFDITNLAGREVLRAKSKPSQRAEFRHFRYKVLTMLLEPSSQTHSSRITAKANPCSSNQIEAGVQLPYDYNLAIWSTQAIYL